MKLRISGNSVRIRITPSELKALLAQGTLDTSVHFGPAPDQQLKYALELCSDSSIVQAQFADMTILIRLPDNVARQWANTDQVGIEASQPIADGAELEILVEKDFHCLEGRLSENELDRFSNSAACRAL
jgi:hypothetical protein